MYTLIIIVGELQTEISNWLCVNVIAYVAEQCKVFCILIRLISGYVNKEWKSTGKSALGSEINYFIS